MAGRGACRARVHGSKLRLLEPKEEGLDHFTLSFSTLEHSFSFLTVAAPNVQPLVVCLGPMA
jgi:hypothetical protein